MLYQCMSLRRTAETFFSFYRMDTQEKEPVPTPQYNILIMYNFIDQNLR